MDKDTLKKIMQAVSEKMTANREYLVELDARNGDGDLGISMDQGFKSVFAFLSASEETDLGRLMLGASSVFNDAAPSSLGTILSFGMMGMAKALRGKQEASLAEVAAALNAGIENIMAKAKSKPGEKTVLDALAPAIEALNANADKSAREACEAAADAAAQGCEATKQMKSVHGRAAYYGEKSIGLVDGGAVAGKLIFEAIADAMA